MLMGSFARFVFDSSGWTLSPTSGIKMSKAFHLLVREIASEAVIYVCHWGSNLFRDFESMKAGKLKE